MICMICRDFIISIVYIYKSVYVLLNYCLIIIVVEVFLTSLIFNISQELSALLYNFNYF